MKSSHTLGITISLLIVIAGVLIISAFDRPAVDAQAVIVDPSSRAQVTATPVDGDNSVIGSTDGIVVMGILIVLVAVTPLFFRRKNK
jgi:hypothetical protein